MLTDGDTAEIGGLLGHLLGPWDGGVYGTISIAAVAGLSEGRLKNQSGNNEKIQQQIKWFVHFFHKIQVLSVPKTGASGGP